MSQRITASVSPAVWQQFGSGLEPGHLYECSTGYVPDDDTTGLNSGQAAQPVGATGTISFWIPLDMVTGDMSRPGTLYGWLREAGTPQTSPPIMLDTGVPAFSTWRVEVGD